MKNITEISINKLHTFEGHPYKVLDNEEMRELTKSVREYGILSPITVRPLENITDEYEVISGHRRLYAANSITERKSKGDITIENNRACRG